MFRLEKDPTSCFCNSVWTSILLAAECKPTLTLWGWRLGHLSWEGLHEASQKDRKWGFFIHESESLIWVPVSLQTRDRIGSGGPVVDCRGLLENDGWGADRVCLQGCCAESCLCSWGWLLFLHLGPSLRAASAKSRCRTRTPPVLQGGGAAGWNRPFKRTICRRNGSEGRTPEGTATPLRTDPPGINRLTYLRDTVSLKHHIKPVSVCDVCGQIPFVCFNRAANDGSGTGVLPPHTDRGQHLAWSADTSVWPHRKWGSSQNKQLL